MGLNSKKLRANGLEDLEVFINYRKEKNKLYCASHFFPQQKDITFQKAGGGKKLEGVGLDCR